MTRCPIGVVCGLILAAWSARGADYFVNKQGSDANDGHANETAFLTIQRGVDALQPGDILTIGPGEYFENVCRTNLGGPIADTVIRSEIPRTAVLRGDLPAPEFQPVDGFQFVYAASFARQPTAVLEHDTLRTLTAKANTHELEFDPGFFHYDAVAGMLYISSSDLRSPVNRRYTVAVNGNSGLDLTNPQRVIIEGLAATGFYPSWGINLNDPVSCVVRDCVTYMSVGGVRLGPAVQLGNPGGSNNVVENCESYGHTFGGIVRYGANHDVIRNCHTYRSKTEGAEYFGIMHYSTMYGPLLITNNISWGQNFDYSVKPIGQDRLERNVSLGYIRINPGTMVHNLIGGGNEYDRSSAAPADNTLFLRESGLNRDFEFADPLNLDFRLQTDSRFRGTAPDGTDRGPYPYATNVFYAATNGNDAASGLSMRAPWRTLGHALAALRPGDTLYLAEGSYTAVTWNATCDGSAPIHIRGRGLGAVVITGRLEVAGGNGMVFERLQFDGGATVRGSGDVTFDNCTFFGAADGLTADGVQGLRVTHALFAGAALVLTQSTAVVLSGNLYAHTNTCALRTDTLGAILYSDCNSYEDTTNCWRVGNDTWPLDGMPDGHDRYSVVLTPQFDTEAAVPTLLNAALFKGRGPLDTALGIHRAYDPDVAMKLVGPFLHSAGDTTANIEWWSSHPATFSLAWGEGAQATNLVTRASPTRFTTFSLTGLAPGHTYTFEIRSANPSAFDTTGTVPVLTPTNARLSFATSGSAAEPVVYYVAPDGDDGNTGLSRVQALRTVGCAADRVGPGDTVLIAGGTYRETVRIRSTGTPDRPILFKSALGEKPVFRGENLDRAFEVVGKQDIRFDGLYFQGFEWAVMVLRYSDRARMSRCLHADVEADHCAGLWIQNCVLNGLWADLTAVRLSDCPESRIENNVFVMTWIQHLSFDAAQGILRNNIFCENTRGKAHQSPVSLGSDATESINCFYVRWPESERLAINSRTLPQRRARTTSDSFAANPMMAGVTGWRQGWQQDGAGELDFDDYFATNPEVVRRGAGLQPEAFLGFPCDPVDWPYNAVWAEGFIGLTNAAGGLARAGQDADALSAYTNLAATVPMSGRLKADVLDQAALCAERLNNHALALQLATSIPIQPLSVRRRMALRLARGEYAALLGEYADSKMGGYTFHLNYLYPELEDVMADLFYFRSIAYAETGDLVKAEADLKIMNDKRFTLQYRSGEAIHDLAWLRLGDFYRTYLHDDDKALIAYTNVLSRTTWAPWGWPAKPLATGGSETFEAAASNVCEILDGRGLHEEANGVWFDLRKAQAEAAADLLDAAVTLSRFSQALDIPGVFSAEMAACEARIDALQYSRATVVSAIAAMVAGLTGDARDILAAAAVGAEPADQRTALRALLLFAPLGEVTDLLDRTEAVFYVSRDGGHVPPYDSWAKAATNIQDAAGAAADASGAIIWVSNGLYRLTNQVVVGDFRLRSWPDGLTWRDTTIINGNYPSFSNRCFNLTHTNALVEGFTITNGYKATANGGGVYMSGGTLRNCVVTGNVTSNYHGGGVYATGANCMITNCDIIGNMAGGTVNSGGSGGGLRLESGAKVWNSRIIGNRAPIYSASGGGVYIGSGGTMVNCQIISNTVSGGYGTGGIFCQGTVVLRNCLIMGNGRGTVMATAGIGSHAWGSLNCSIESCTIVGNRGAGILAYFGGGAFYLKNTICHRNDDNTIQTFNNDPLVMSNSCVSSTNNMTGGSGTFTNDPAFVNAGAQNFQLRNASPCVNTGTNQSWMRGAVDLAGHRRIDSYSGIVDMGCYESVPRGSVFSTR